MELSDERRAALLAYCKLTELADDPEAQTLIPIFYAAAVGYMEGAGISPPPEGTARRSLYELCVNIMVLGSWDGRDAVGNTSAATENPAFRRMFNQLKFTAGIVSESDTGGEG